MQSRKTSPVTRTEFTPPALRNSPIAAALSNAINRMDSATQIRESLALAYWPRVVGAQAAAATQAESVRDGVLFVRTKSSVWSHELMLHKARLLLGLNRLLGAQVISEIIFRAQGIAPPEPPADPDNPTDEELAALVLEPHERERLRASLEALFSITDEHARESIARRITLEARLRHWRLEHHWKVCPRCDSLHNTPYRICPICRLS